MSHAEQADPPASAGNPAINVSSAAPPSSTSSESAPDPKGSVVKRAMDATAEKLARGKSLLSQSQPSLPQEGSHRRMFSLTRGKGKEKLGDEGVFTSLLLLPRIYLRHRYRTSADLAIASLRPSPFIPFSITWPERRGGLAIHYSPISFASTKSSGEYPIPRIPVGMWASREST